MQQRTPAALTTYPALDLHTWFFMDEKIATEVVEHEWQLDGACIRIGVEHSEDRRMRRQLEEAIYPYLVAQFLVHTGVVPVMLLRQFASSPMPSGAAFLVIRFSENATGAADGAYGPTQPPGRREDLRRRMGRSSVTVRVVIMVVIAKSVE